MVKRHPRDGIRDRWSQAIIESDVGTACKYMLMVLKDRMNDRGVVEMTTKHPRQELADLLRVHPQRIAERIAEAKQAGLLDQVAGTGVRGRGAQYFAVIPNGLRTAERYASDGFVTGERYALIGTHTGLAGTDCVPVSGTHNTRAYVDNHSQRSRDERNLRSGPDPDETQRRSEERVPGCSPVDADSPDPAGSATKNRKASAA